MNYFNIYLLARLIDNLLQQVRELLHYGDGLPTGEADAVHGGGGVVGRPEEKETIKISVCLCGLKLVIQR